MKKHKKHEKRRDHQKANHQPFLLLLLLHSLAQAGCSKIFITSRKAQACEEACAALNALPNTQCKAISVPADIAKPGEVERLVKEVEKHTDKVDILFANAGATWGAE